MSKPILQGPIYKLSQPLLQIEPLGFKSHLFVSNKRLVFDENLDQNPLNPPNSCQEKVLPHTNLFSLIGDNSLDKVIVENYGGQQLFGRVQ